MFTGVGLAYAMAYAAFGYLTLSTVSLGSIVAGSGINYAIVYPPATASAAAKGTRSKTPSRMRPSPAARARGSRPSRRRARTDR